MTDIPPAPPRTAPPPKPYDTQRVATPGRVRSDGRPDVRLLQRALVRASLITCPPPGEIKRDRRR